MAENDREPRDHALGAELPIDDVQVGAAHSTCADSNQELAFSGSGCGRLDNLGARCGPSLGDCFHFAPSSVFNTTSMRSASKRQLKMPASGYSKWRSGAPR